MYLVIALQDFLVPNLPPSTGSAIDGTAIMFTIAEAGAVKYHKKLMLDSLLANQLDGGGWITLFLYFLFISAK
jgi:hypothetical protein